MLRLFLALLKKISIAIAVLLLLIGTLPFLIPLSQPTDMTQTQPFENSAYYTLDGHDYHYRTYLPLEGEPKGKIFMVHGLGGSTFSFEKAASALQAQNYTVVLVDLPGFGYSSRFPGYDHSQRNRADALWTLLDHVEAKWPEALKQMKWHLAGHSMGGGTVYAMTLKEEQRTASLVLIDGALVSAPPSSPLTEFAPATQWGMVLLEYVFISENRIKGFLESAYGETPTYQEIQGYLMPLKTPGTARSAIDMVRTAENASLFKGQSLSLPVLAIWGENDNWVPLTDTQQIKDNITQLEVNIIPGAGHCPMETHAETFNQMLLQWLESL